MQYPDNTCKDELNTFKDTHVKTTWAGSGQCAQCRKELLIGVDIIYILCKTHAICQECLRRYPSVIDLDDCSICMEEKDKDEQETKTRGDSKNSLPIIPLTNSNGVKTGTTSSKSSFPTQCQVKTVSSITKEYTKLDIPHEVSWPCGMFNTGSQDTIIVCGEKVLPTSGKNIASLTVLNSDGVCSTYTLSRGQIVKFGCCITDDLFMICLAYDDNGKDFKYKLQSIYLDVTSAIPTTITPHDFSILSTNIQCSIHALKICKQQYGVHCWHKYRDVKGRTKYMNVINVYPLDSLLLKGSSCTIQSHILWGKRTIKLQGSIGGVYDTVDVTPKRLFCLCVHRDTHVRIFNRVGLHLLTVGRYWLGNQVKPGNLWGPITVKCTQSGGMIVIERNANVQIFKPDISSWWMAKNRLDDRYGTWKILREDASHYTHSTTHFGVFSETAMWSTTWEKTIHVYKIRQ